MDINLPKGLIKYSEAKELNQNFIKTRGKVIDHALKKKDAISSWFSLEELKDYIAFVESEGKAKGVTVNGLRVYFGTYPKTEKKADKKNMSTVFFTPTEAKVGSLQKDGVAVAAESFDITAIDNLNGGHLGNPPSAVYPQ
jgi:hypothetical protein